MWYKSAVHSKNKRLIIIRYFIYRVPLKYLICRLVAKTKLVGRFSIRDLVVSKPVSDCSESTLEKKFLISPMKMKSTFNF